MAEDEHLIKIGSCGQFEKKKRRTQQNAKKEQH
jgi:hypothetical protein